MAEYLFKDMLAKNKVEGVSAISRATSDEEEGNPCHYGTRAVLEKLKIDCSAHRAHILSRSECDEADMLVCMDQYNVWHVAEICGEKNKSKIVKLLDLTPRGGDVDDPWYTHDFRRCYRDISFGLEVLLTIVKEKR